MGAGLYLRKCFNTIEISVMIIHNTARWDGGGQHGDTVVI